MGRQRFGIINVHLGPPFTKTLGLMSVPLAAPSSKLLPFEVAILQAVARTLPASMSALLSQQLAVVNKVQRVLDWNEIELYCMQWFKVRWPDHVLFPRRDEHSLAEVQCAFGGTEVSITVWALHGHVFSLEAATGLKALASGGANFEVRHVQVGQHET